MTAADPLGDLWHPATATAFRTRRRLALVEAAARGCDAFAGQWCVGTDQRAVRVRSGAQLWLVYPDPSSLHWVAAPEVAGEPDLGRAGWLPLSGDEARVPSRAWGTLLAGLPLAAEIDGHKPPAPSSTKAAGASARDRLAGRPAHYATLGRHHDPTVW